MKSLFLVIKPCFVPLVSSLGLHALVFSSLLVFSSTPGSNSQGGGTQQAYFVSFAEDGYSLATSAQSEISEIPLVPDRTESQTALKAPVLQKITHIKKYEQESSSSEFPASRTQEDAATLADGSAGSFGSGDGINGGSAKTDGSRGSSPGQEAFVRAALLKAPKPPYPELARLAGFEGQVVLEAAIDTSGNVIDAAVQQSSGRKDCDASAQRTVLKHWQFNPARINGAPIACQQKIIVVYNLRG